MLGSRFRHAIRRGATVSRPQWEVRQWPSLGKDGGEPVTDDYPGDSPWAFVGGRIKRVVVDVSGQPFVDLAGEVRMAFARD